LPKITIQAQLGMKKDLLEGFELVDEKQSPLGGPHFRSDSNKVATILTLGIIGLFIIFAAFVSINLKTGIAPDEPAHFLFSKHYATTLGIPADTEQTQQTGWYIQHNPFLYYWVNGRILAFLHWIMPNITDWQALQGLRLLSAIYSSLSLWFLYKSSKLLIENHWLQLLPVFLLSNTLMFVFISGAVSYDPMAILFCFSGAYFLIRAFKMNEFWKSSLMSLLMVGLGCLVKYPVTPFAFITVISWLIFFFKKHKLLPKFEIKPNLVLLLTVVIVLMANVILYGRNLILYRGLTPDCVELFTKTQCELSPYYQRAVAIGVPDKPSLLGSIRQGGPTPLAYFLDSWNRLMLQSIYGILAHIDYEPRHIISFFQAFYLMIALLAARFVRKLDLPWAFLTLISAFYTTVVFFTNISSELAFNYTHAAAIQGRYLFPIIGLVYLLVTWVIVNIKSSWARSTVIAYAILLFLYSGPIKFILNWNTIFKDWFIH